MLTMEMYSNDASTRGDYTQLAIERSIQIDVNKCDKDSCAECDENNVEVASADPSDVAKRVGSYHDKLTTS